MKNQYKKHNGFTLVEMIISMALFAILMTPIYSMVISSMSHNKNGAVKQTAALHGQEIIEEIKSGDIITTKDADGNIIGISKIGDIPISPSTNKGDLGEGYEATVTITKNPSITLHKKSTPEEEALEIKTSNFNINLISGANNTTDIKSDNNNGKLNYLDSEDTLRFVIIAKTEENNKLIEIRDKNNNIVLQDGWYNLADADKSNQIKVVVNFGKYKIINKNVKISVFNQDNIPLNICLQKSMDLYVKIDTKLGNVRVYDNRSEDGVSSKLGELYDLEVKVTNQKEEIFTEKISQNINVN